MNGESNINMDTPLCVTQLAGEDLLLIYNREPSLAVCDDLEWGDVGRRRRLQREVIYV